MFIYKKFTICSKNSGESENLNIYAKNKNLDIILKKTTLK